MALLMGLALALTACGGDNRTEEPQPESTIGEDEDMDVEVSPATDDEEALYALKTADYQEKSIQEFNKGFEPYQHSYSGYGPSHPDPEFMQTLWFSTMELLGVENHHVPFSSAGIAHEDWMLDYVISWRIDHPESVTIGERDRVLADAQDAVQEAFAAASQGAEEAYRLGEELQAAFDQIAAELSQDWVDLDIAVEHLQLHEE